MAEKFARPPTKSRTKATTVAGLDRVKAGGTLRGVYTPSPPPSLLAESFSLYSAPSFPPFRHKRQRRAPTKPSSLPAVRPPPRNGETDQGCFAAAAILPNITPPPPLAFCSAKSSSSRRRNKGFVHRAIGREGNEGGRSMQLFWRGRGKTLLRSRSPGIDFAI